MKSVTALPAIVLLLVATAHAQQPYSGLEARPIKALSEQQITDLKQGRGMGLALAAELNGYPGPSHILELAGALRLTDAQKQRVDSLFTAMKAEAIPLGEQLIAAEAALDQLFAQRRITEASLHVSLENIGRTQAALRATHLKYHLSTLDILSTDQMRRYAELRGYGGHAGNQQHHR